MNRKTSQSEWSDDIRTSSGMGRRAFMAAATSAATAAFAAAAYSQERDYGKNAPPVRYPEPDVVVLDKKFAKYKIGNTPIQRLYTGTQWAEGPAWCAAGKYLVDQRLPQAVGTSPGSDGQALAIKLGTSFLGRLEALFFGGC